jgi:hypothetical protein
MGKKKNKRKKSKASVQKALEARKGKRKYLVFSCFLFLPDLDDLFYTPIFIFHKSTTYIFQSDHLEKSFKIQD